MTESYIELHARSAFSFLEGACVPEELVQVSRAFEAPAIALLDRDGLYGAPRFHMAAKKCGIKAHIGAEITVDFGDDRNPQRVSIPVLVQTRTGYQNLCRLITLMKLRVPKHTPCAATPDELAAHAHGLICLTGDHTGPIARTLYSGEASETNNCSSRGTSPTVREGSALSTAKARALPDGRASAPVAIYSNPLARAKWLVDIFGKGNVYAELQRHFNRAEEAHNHAVLEIARQLKLPLLATNGVCYATRAQRQIADVFTCLRNHKRLDTAGRLLAMNSERFVKSPQEMNQLFADLPEALANTVELSSRLEFTLKDLGYEFPKYPVAAGETMASVLRQHTEAGARLRYTGNNGAPTYEQARPQLERELTLIEHLKLEGYFLIVWDIVQFCKREKIMVQGRGSAANSAVCYSLGITAVDPIKMELLFERFLSAERGEWPDIDLDLPSGEQRERAIQYVYGRYGKRGAAMTANCISYRGRSAAREVGKVLGFDNETLGRLSGLVHTWEWKDPKATNERQFQDAGLDLRDPRIRKFFQLYESVQDLPRHLGQHSGGMVICQGALDSVVPLEPAAMPDRVIVQWDKEDCADLGLIKVDLLGLGMMAVLEDSIQLIRDSYKENVDLAHIPPDDSQVFEALQKADTVGWFQVESRAQMSFLPRMRPANFYDIVVEVAIIRPGPIVGDMVHPYLKRRKGIEPVTYAHPDLEPVLKRTLGVPLFQEQLLKMAMVCARFSGGEAEELRRAFGFKRSEARMREIEVKLRRGMELNGIRPKVQDEIVQSIASFALYGFPESHAASFALLAYASGYLKCHYLAAFMAATLNNQPMGFYQPFTLIKDAQRHGLKVKPIDLTRSDWLCTIEEERENRGTGEGGTGKELVMRLGLCYVKGLSETSGQAIVRERAKLPFAGIGDLSERVPELRKHELRKLAAVGALNFMQGNSPKSKTKTEGRTLDIGLWTLDKRTTRRDALWQVERAARAAGALYKSLQEPEGNSPLLAMTLPERVNADLHGTGLTIGRHPVAIYRRELEQLGALRTSDIQQQRNGSLVRVAGWVVSRQRPGTAKGFVFLNLEDETGMANVIIAPQKFDQYRLAIASPFLLIEGMLQNQDNVVSVKATYIQSLRSNLSVPLSHDFH